MFSQDQPIMVTQYNPNNPNINSFIQKKLEHYSQTRIDIDDIWNKCFVVVATIF